ncbi:hypothetical protein MRX96_058721 [Rhipicephalus microplus]
MEGESPPVLWDAFLRRGHQGCCRDVLSLCGLACHVDDDEWGRELLLWPSRNHKPCTASCGHLHTFGSRSCARMAAAVTRDGLTKLISDVLVMSRTLSRGCERWWEGVDSTRRRHSDLSSEGRPLNRRLRWCTARC